MFFKKKNSEDNGGLPGDEPAVAEPVADSLRQPPKPDVENTEVLGFADVDVDAVSAAAADFEDTASADAAVSTADAAELSDATKTVDSTDKTEVFEIAQPAGQPASQSADQPASQSASLPASQPAGQPAAPDSINPALADLPAFLPLTVGEPLHAEPKKKRSLKWLWISLIIIFGLLLIVYGVGAYFFSTHFGFNTVINGVEVSFKTAEDVEQNIANQVNAYQLEINGREASTGFIVGSQIDMEYVPDNQVNQMLVDQNFWLWPMRLLPTSDDNGVFAHASININQQKLDALIDALPMMDKTKMKQSEDAKLVFINGRYTIQPESLGTQLDTDKAKSIINEAILSTLAAVDLNKEGCYSSPEVLSTDVTLAGNMEKFNKFVPFCITYVMGDSQEVLDGITTLNWVTNAAGPGPYELDYGSVVAWVADFAARHNTVGATRPIKNGFGEDKTVTGGTYGWEINQEAEVNAILAAAANHAGEERAPYTWSNAASLGVPDWGTTYVEVDFTAQHMWYFVNGELKLDCDVVTGKPDGEHNTPEGVYFILEKKSPAVLRGPRQVGGGYEWEANVRYWVAVTIDGVGFHDATWQPRFGGDWYVYNGSHGCINMSYNDADLLYSMIEDNTPVVMHY